MAFCIVLFHAGIVPAIFVFLLWSLPGVIDMFALSLCVQRINEVLPGAAYVFLYGLNVSTVGIVALAVVQLAENGIKDTLTRILVILDACAGLLYTVLW
jgi:chromate transport protein ChrA